jgi:hypothetical protein
MNPGLGANLLAGIFVPGNVVARAPGDQEIEVAVLIHVKGADVVSLLIAGDEMVGKVSLAVVFEPPSFLVTVGAGGGVEVPIAIHIQDDQGMGLFERGVNRVLRPGRSFKPDDSLPVSAAGDEICFSVVVDVARMNVGRADLLVGDDAFLPGFGGVFGSFPPSEVVSGWRGISLGAGRRVWTSIPVDISEAEVMGEAGGVFVRECVSFPTLGRARAFRHRQPDQTFGERCVDGLSAVGDQIHPAIPVDITFEQSMDAVEIFAGDAQRPRLGEGPTGLFEPDNQAGLIPGTDEIQIPVSVHIESLAVDEIMAGCGVEHDLFPIGSDEEAGLVTAIGNNVGSSILREIASDRGQTLGTLMDDMFLPRTFGGVRRRWQKRVEDGGCEGEPGADTARKS